MRIPRGVFLPNLCTLGNGVCGFAALVKILKVDVVREDGVIRFQNPELFATAAWLILLGMVFDVFDGRLARLSGKTSDLGAQLDSFCDLTTFGLAPAALVIGLNRVYGDLWARIVWFFSLAYFLGALLRLARFNVENDHEESAHLCFKGLPSPAAAGCVASLVILHHYVLAFRQRELVWLGGFIQKESLQAAAGWIPFVLPFLALVLGYTMVSIRFKYDHVASRLFNRWQTFETFVYLIFGSLLVFVVPEVVFPAVFIGYLASAPLGALVRRIRRTDRDREPEEVRELPPKVFP